MSNLFRILVLTTICMFMSMPNVMAEEEDPVKAGQEAIQQSLVKIYGSLDDQQRQHFFLIYNGYNTVESVKIVQEDVKNAVQACGKENPDIKALMDSRYKTWSDAIDPVLKEASANIQNMILAQDYASADDIQNVLDTIDATRDMANARIDKIPVSSPEACEFLREKMTETQEKLISLLETSLKTVNQMFTDPAASE